MTTLTAAPTHISVGEQMTNVDSQARVSRWLTHFALAEAGAAEVEAWVDRTVERILHEVPEIRRVQGLSLGIENAVREHWVAFLAELCKPEFRFWMPPQAEKIVVAVASSQLPLETLIRFYRVAQQATWTYITTVINEIEDADLDHAEVLIYFWDRAGLWIDHSITRSVEIYQSERGRVLEGAAARRYEMVRTVLNGDVDDVRKISSDLGGYPMSAHHTALVLACDNHNDVELLESIAREMARATGATQPLLVRPGGRRLWSWIATRGAPDVSALTTAFTKADNGRMRVAVGSAADGVRGFVTSHAEAELTLAVIPAGGPDRIAAYSDVELLVLLGCSAEVDKFVRRTLGDLVRADDDARRLRHTISVYLRTGGSVDIASRQLTVHRNTVRYRIGQAEGILGYPISKASPELTVALQHLASYHSDGVL